MSCCGGNHGNNHENNKENKSGTTKQRLLLIAFAVIAIAVLYFIN